MLTVFSALLALSPVAAPTTDAPSRSYVSPLVVVRAGDPRIAALDALPKRAVEPNAPGFLLALARVDDLDEVSRAAGFVAGAHRAGRTAGLSFTLPLAQVPSDPRAAEAARPDGLVPGLGRALADSREADVFLLAFPGPPESLRARSYLLRKIASEIHAGNPKARVALALRPDAEGIADRDSRALLEENAPYVDLLGVTADASANAADLRAKADALALGRPLLVSLPPQADAPALLSAALRLAPADAPGVAAELPEGADLSPLERFAALLRGDFGPDSRLAEAKGADGRAIPVTRLVSGADLGGVLFVPARDAAGAPAEEALTLTLDAPAYAVAEVFELATGRSRRFELPRSKEAPKLSLSTAHGPLALVLTAREQAPDEATSARVGVRAVRGMTAEEILARHQAWRAARDARWSRFTAVSRSAMRFRFADLNNTLELALEGPFFDEAGRGYDWVWRTAYINGVRWRGKKLPELPLLQPEKVSELPLGLTLDDAYAYTLVGEETVLGIPCWALDFTPKPAFAERSLYEGRVFVSRQDFAAIRVKTRQLHLTGEVQSVDETTDFTEVPAGDGGPPLRMPTHTTGQWVLVTFSRTTVVERETTLSDVKIDPEDFAERRKEAYASRDVIVRDTERGVRYLERRPDGERVVVEDSKSARLFAAAGVFWDSSADMPLPLLGAYYLDLNFRKKHQQVQVFFGGVLLAASFNEPRLFGSKVDLGVDLFGIAIRGTDDVFVEGEKDEAQRVKQRSFAANLNFGYPLARHVKATFTAGATHRDFGAADETAPDFAVPSNHWVTRLQGQITWDLDGWALSARAGWNQRSRWDPWGYPGNPDYDSDKDTWKTWGATLAKDFHLPRFQRIRSSVTWVGSSNTDRFSKYGFGNFGGTGIRGFSGASLRGEHAFIGRGAYGFVVGDVFRLEAIYEHALVKDRTSGLDWANFGGAGISGQLPGPWTTLVQVDAGLPVVGRQRGQRGFVLNLVFLKLF